MILLMISVFSLAEMATFAQSIVSLCEQANPPKSLYYLDNCSLVCSTNFQEHSINTKRDEVALCIDNSTAVTCATNADCRKYHLSATCKKLPCLCKSLSRSQFLYVFDAKGGLKIPSIDTCVVPSKWASPELPLVPFPWGTLLVVLAIVASFIVCLLAVRWLAPIIRRMQAKNSRRDRRVPIAEEGTVYASVPLQESLILPSILPSRNQRICIANPRAHFIRATQRRIIHDRAMHDSVAVIAVAAPSGERTSSPDKPPPYELAIQEEPPSYDELERQPLNEPTDETVRQNNSENDNHLRPTASAASIATV